MKLASFNINGVNRRLANLLEWLAESQPDAVCLQELKAEDSAFPAAALEAAGYGAVWQGQRSWNGVAILARHATPVLTRRGLPEPAGLPPSGDTQARYIEAAVQGVLVGCLYLPNGNPWPGPKFDYKLAWFERLIAHAAGLQASGLPVVLVGDYNVVPTDSDIYDTRSWARNALLRPEARDAYRRLVALGFTDALRAVAGDARAYTFWSYLRDAWPRDAGLRLDHVLLSGPLTLVEAGVDRWVRGVEGASDHAPVWVEVEPASGPF